jgi:hypothetical protein
MKHFPLLILALVVLAAVGAAACADDSSDASADADEIARVEELAVKAQVTAAMATYRVEGLHNIDDESQKASEIQPGWAGPIDRMHQVTVGTQWPDELTGMADDLATGLEEASAALDAEDLETYKAAIGEAHGAWHDLEHDAYAFIGGHEMDDSAGHGESTPAASEDPGGNRSEAPSPGATTTNAGDDHGEDASPEATADH